jgi:hypothetical protein
MGKRMRRAAAVGAAATILSGCFWSQPGYDSGGGGYNKNETEITAASASSLAEVWTATLDDGSASAIVQSSSGSLHMADTSGVYAIDLATGGRQWRTPVAGLAGIVTHPVGRDDLVIPTIDPAATPDGRLVRLDAATGAVMEALPSPGAVTPGTEQLRTARSGDWVVTTYASGWLDFVCLCPMAQSGFQVTNLADPALSWTWTFGGAPSGYQVSVLTNPIIIGDRFYAGEGISRLDPTTLELIRVSANLAGWDLADPCTTSCAPDFRVEHPGEVESQEIAASPDRTAVAVGIGDTLRVIDLATGATEWTTDARYGTADPTWTPGHVFRLTTYPQDTLVAYPAGGCAGECAPSWSTPLPGEPVGQASAVSDLVFVGTADGTVAAYPTTCTDGCAPAWSVNLGSAITASPIVTGGRVVVGTADGRVVAFGVPN